MTEALSVINKDLDVLMGFEKRELKPATVDVLSQLVSVDEAFSFASQDPSSSSELNVDMHQTSNNVRWSNYKSFCLASFQTRASDFAKSEVSVLFSKRVRDRLAELAVTTDEEQLITLMQQNEENLRNQIKRESDKLETLHKEEKHWQMIELVSKACQLLSNTKSPQFYPAQFMLVLDLVDNFGRMVYQRISAVPTSQGDFLKEKKGTTQLLSLNWSMILCRTSRLLPRILLQIAFLRCIKYHPFKTLADSIRQISQAIRGLGQASAGIYASTYLINTIYTYFPETSPEFILPMFTHYVRHLQHLKDGGFHRQFNIIDYSFSKYLETHKPALRYFLSATVSVCDSIFLKQMLDEFYGAGQPSSFILDALLLELPPKFVTKAFNALVLLIDKSDDLVSHADLLHSLATKLSQAPEAENSREITNELWGRLKEMEDIENFVYVALPLTVFIGNFRPLLDVNFFLQNVADRLASGYESRRDTTSISYSSKLTEGVKGMIEYAVGKGRNFQEVLTHISSVVKLMDYLDENNLVSVARFILNDVSTKPFDLNDHLTIRILLELSQLLYQSLSVLSPVDIVEKTNNSIQWFLYRADFGSNSDAHLGFLKSARTSFPTSVRLLSVVSRISLRLCNNNYARKASYDTLRAILAFAVGTIASISDYLERSSLYLLASNTALTCNVVCFAHTCFDEFLNSLVLSQPSPSLLKLCQNSLSLALIIPAKPGKDPFEIIRNLCKSVAKIQWPDDEALVFILDAIIITAHMLRSEYVLNVEGIDSNNILFAGSDEYKERGYMTIAQLLEHFTSGLDKFKSKGIMATRTKIPTLALRAIYAMTDLFEFNESLCKIFVTLARLIGDSSSVKDLRIATASHIKRILANNSLGERFIAEFFDI